MATTGQTWTRFASNDFQLEWAGITDSDAADPTDLKDLTGKIVKFALARYSASGAPVTADPILDFASDDASPRVTVPNPVTGDPHVVVAIQAADTEGLAPIDTDYYVELEVFDSGDTVPVVVATGTLTLRPNVENA